MNKEVKDFRFLVKQRDYQLVRNFDMLFFTKKPKKVAFVTANLPERKCLAPASQNSLQEALERGLHS